MARGGDVDDGLIWMAEALQQAPAERPEVGRMLRANLAGWEDQLPRRRAILEHGAGTGVAAFRPDGRVIMTGSDDRTARFWDTATGRPLSPPLEHTGFVQKHAFSPNGRLAATGCNDGSVRLWDAATGQAVGPVLTRRHAPECSGDGARWHFRPTAGSSWLAIRPRGRSLACAQRPAVRAARCSRLGDRRLFLARWASSAPDRPRRETAADLGSATGKILGPTIVADRVQWARYSPDGRLIVTADGETTCQLWDAVSGQAVASHRLADCRFGGAIFSADSRLLFTYGYESPMRAWD